MTTAHSYGDTVWTIHNDAIISPTVAKIVIDATTEDYYLQVTTTEQIRKASTQIFSSKQDLKDSL